MKQRLMIEVKVCIMFLNNNYKSPGLELVTNCWLKFLTFFSFLWCRRLFVFAKSLAIASTFLHCFFHSFHFSLLGMAFDFGVTGSTDCMVPSLLSISLIYGAIPSMVFIILATSTIGCPSSSPFRILVVLCTLTAKL